MALPLIFCAKSIVFSNCCMHFWEWVGESSHLYCLWSSWFKNNISVTGLLVYLSPQRRIPKPYYLERQLEFPLGHSCTQKSLPIVGEKGGSNTLSSPRVPDTPVLETVDLLLLIFILYMHDNGLFSLPQPLWSPFPCNTTRLLMMKLLIGPRELKWIFAAMYLTSFLIVFICISPFRYQREKQRGIYKSSGSSCIYKWENINSGQQ